MCIIYYVCSSRCLPGDGYTRKIKRTNAYICIYTVGKTFPPSGRGESRGREFLTRRTKAFELAVWSGGRCAMMKLHKRSGCSMVLVKWLALCAIREKKREKEKEKCHRDYYSFRPRERRGKNLQSCYFVRERRIVADLDRGPKIPQMLGNRVERKGIKKADENWPGIDRDRWHLTWHLTNCEISLLRRGIIADQRSIYFSQPRVFISPSNKNQIPIGNSISPLPLSTRPSPRRIKRRKDGRPRKECDHLSASICLDRKIASRRPSIEESLLTCLLNRRNKRLKVGKKIYKVFMEYY